MPTSLALLLSLAAFTLAADDGLSSVTLGRNPTSVIPAKAGIQTQQKVPGIGRFRVGFLAARGENPVAARDFSSDQGAQSQGAPITIKPAVAQMVMVDAFVVDRKGRPVTDLKMEDFALLEDDKKVTISAFVAPTTPAPASSREPSAGQAAAPVRDHESLTLVLYVDRRLLGPTGRRRALDQAFGIAESHMAQGARAVVIADDNGLRPLTPITTDPTVIRVALTRIQGWATISPAVTDTRNVLENIQAALEGGMASCEKGLSQLIDIVRGYAAFRDMEAREVSDRLIFVVNALQPLPGRKALIYVSEGLEQRPGLQLYDQLQEICPTVMSKDASAIHAPMMELETSPPLREATARANAARVTLYPIDARGLMTPSGVDVSQKNRRFVPSARNDRIRDANLVSQYQLIAEETGGFALLNGLDPKAAMKRFNADEQGHYILGFIPGEADGKVHRLWLRLAGTAQDKRNVEIRHRESYLRAELPARRGQRALSALLFGLEENSLEVSVAVERTSSSNARIRVSLSLSALKPLVGEGAPEARIQMVVSFRPVSGEERAVTVREKDASFSLNAVEMSRDAGRRVIEIDVPVTGVPYEFAIGLEDLISGAASYLRRSLGPASKM